MELLFASNNNHKVDEIKQLFSPHTILTPKQVNTTFEFEETGDTFIANAHAKAQHLFKLTNRVCFADDSGLVVDALNGEPGIYSARYGFSLNNRLLSDSERNNYLLTKLEDLEHQKRRARFVCAIALVLPNDVSYVVQQSVSGYIAFNSYGKGGFGYDPIFLVGESNKTMASLSSSEKNKISHRALAALDMIKIIEGLNLDGTN